MVQPYGYVTSDWGDCLLNPGLRYCGSGTQSRTPYCVDIRNYTMLNISAPVVDLSLNQSVFNSTSGNYSLVLVCGLLYMCVYVRVRVVLRAAAHTPGTRA